MNIQTPEQPQTTETPVNNEQAGTQTEKLPENVQQQTQQTNNEQQPTNPDQKPDLNAAGQTTVQEIEQPTIDLDAPYLTEDEQAFVSQFNVQPNQGDPNAGRQDDPTLALKEEIAGLHEEIRNLARKKEDVITDLDDDEDDSPALRKYNAKIEELEKKIKAKEEEEAYNQQVQQYQQIEQVNQGILANFLDKKMYPTLKLFGVDETKMHPFVVEHVKEGLMSKVLYAVQAYEEKYLGGRQAPPNHVKAICDEVWKTFTPGIPKANPAANQEATMVQNKMNHQGTEQEVRMGQLNAELQQIEAKVNEIASAPKNQQFVHQAEIRRLMSRTAQIKDEQEKLKAQQ